MNSLKGLNLNDVWIEDPKKNKEEVYSLFRDHFSEKQHDWPRHFNTKFKILSEAHRNFVDASFADEEIKKVA